MSSDAGGAGRRHGDRLVVGGLYEFGVVPRDPEDGALAEPVDRVEDPGLGQALDAGSSDAVSLGDLAEGLGAHVGVVGQREWQG